MTASLSGVWNAQEFTDNGTLLVGGRLYTYAFGTTTFKAAYTEATGTTQQTYTSDGAGGQYIALNARGELPAPLYLTAGSYDLALKRADGSTVWTRRADPIGDSSAVYAAAGGAALIGGVAQVVNSITALRALLKTSASKSALVTGYYAAFDGGGGFYAYDASDTTSADNGGTIIVATDGGRWKLSETGYISLKQFGAKGDTKQVLDGVTSASSATYTSATAAFTAADVGKYIGITGAGAAGAYLSTTIASYVSATSVTLAVAATTSTTAALTIFGSDDTATTQSCMTYCAANFRTVWVPSGNFLITAQVTTNRPISMIGEMHSPSSWNNQSPMKGSVFISGMTIADYMFNFNSASVYERGMYLERLKFFTANRSANCKGTIFHSMGWDCKFKDVVWEGFTQGACWLDYVQDGLFDNCGFINCGTANTSAALTFKRNSNLLAFHRLHIEGCPFMMDIADSTQVVNFVSCHFECSEYPTFPALAAFNVYSLYSQIQMYGGARDITFDGCTFGANTVQGVMAHFSVAASAVPYMLSINAVNVTFQKCNFFQFNVGYQSKFMDWQNSSDSEVSSCEFDGCFVEDYSVKLSGVQFINNTVNFVDSNTTAFYGIECHGPRSEIAGNTLSCSNGGSPAKLSGYVLFYTYSAGPKKSELGDNLFGITQIYKNHNYRFISKTGLFRVLVDLAGSSGNLDLEKYDINALYYFAGATPLSTIVNQCEGQQVKILNKSGAAVNVTNTATVLLKGSVAAPVAANFGLLSLQETMDGNLVEVSRNF